MNAEDMIDPRDPVDRTEIGRKPSADQALLDAINEVDAASKKITFYSLEPAEGEPGVANMVVGSVDRVCAKCGTKATPDTVCLCYGLECTGCKLCCETGAAKSEAEAQNTHVHPTFAHIMNHFAAPNLPAPVVDDAIKVDKMIRAAQKKSENNVDDKSDPFDGGCAHDCADRGTDAPVDPYDKQVDELARCWPGGAFDDAIMEMPRLLGQYQAWYEESKRHKAAAAKAEQRCADIDACIKYIEKHKSVPAWVLNRIDTYPQ